MAIQEFHVLVWEPGGTLKHTVRRASGKWEPLGDVWAATGYTKATRLNGVSCSLCSDTGELHVFVTAQDANYSHMALHAMRRSDESWTPFGDVVQEIVNTHGGQSGPEYIPYFNHATSA